MENLTIAEQWANNVVKTHYEHCYHNNADDTQPMLNDELFRTMPQDGIRMTALRGLWLQPATRFIGNSFVTGTFIDRIPTRNLYHLEQAASQ